jgi:hypothetical protein
MTVSELIKAAYANLGVLDIGSDLEPAQYAQGLQSLNSMLGSWSRGRMTLYGLVEESFALTPGKAVYTVGTGGELDTAWPFQITRAFIRGANGIDYPVQIITPGEYNAITLKTVSERPYKLVYNPKGYPLGSATLYPIPAVAEALHWTAQKVLVSYASIEDTVGVAPEYEEALEFNLSIRLAPKMGVPVSGELRELARQSKSVIPLSVEPARFDGAFGSARNIDGLDGIYSGWL